MCGITGIVGAAVAPGTVQRMTAAIAHRGPDSDGYFKDGPVHLGHRRLSIIDTSERGRQPMVDDTGRYTLVHNGEIYNYEAIKAQLDYPWRTGTDTEVILAAYQQWGPACLERFAGMFAFAIWDRVAERLFIARDRLGIKPLYLYEGGGRLLFGSEIRALLASGLIDARVDRAGLQSYFMYQTVYGDGTMVEGVRMLPPGHYAIWERGKCSLHAWWDIVQNASAEARDMDAPAVKSRVKALLEQSIARRLVSDVPVGAFLSGGIDSSAVVALMAQASAQPVDTFSIVFAEKEYNEGEWSGLMAEKYQTRHHPILLQPSDFLDALPAALASMDHPSGDGINSYVVSQVTRAQGVKVALSGLGGDELFAGYPVFGALPGILQKSLFQWPYGLRKRIAGLYGLLNSSRSAEKKSAVLSLPQVDLESVYKIYRTIYSDRDARGLLREIPSGLHPLDGILAQHADARHRLPRLSQISALEINSYTQSVLLRDTDQMSMAHALEVREPFFDHDLVAFVMGIPDAIKRGSYPKQLLVDALGDMLPPALVHRPKMGFVFPWEQWLRGPLRSFCEARMLAFAQRDCVAAPAQVRQVWAEFQAGKGPWLWTHVWLPVVLEDWLQRNGVKA
jgi:asparagine synthase (glutamine-hydrolysing)